MSIKRNRIIIGTCVLVILFTYVGITQIIFRDNVELNLLNSPLLSIPETEISLLSWFIPILELLAVVLLLFPRSHLIGLYLTISILAIYTCYNLGILYIVPYIPCSCGGMLKFLSWQQQLWITISCLIIAVLTLYLKKTIKSI
ncbi:MauE/DoxX family redox-associated membrane protein [Mesonia ostreae]|uniref:MauE/DoxX family redox-associated membrane protein n=1 Tax=Mesonia ostreae TaxID=861110 RepID=UPI0035D0B11F